MELITLRAFDNYFQAHLLLTKLRDSGLECYLKDEYTVTIDPLLSNAIGGIKLVVKKKDAEEAYELLRIFDEEILQNTHCPKCGSNQILLVPKKTTENYVTAILSWLFSSYAVSAENVYQCSNCGYESKTLPESETAGFL